MENGTPVIIEDSSDGEKLQPCKDLLTEGLSDNSNTSSSSRTVTDSASLNSEDVKVPDSTVIVIDDIAPHENEEVPKSSSKVNGEVQIYKSQRQSDTDSENDEIICHKHTESTKSIFDKDPESSKAINEYDKVLDEKLDSIEKLNIKSSDTEEKLCDKENEGSEKGECELKSNGSDSEVEKELYDKDTENSEFLCDANAESEKVKNDEKPELVKNLGDDTLPDKDNDLDTEDKGCTKKYEPMEDVCDKDSELNDKVINVDSDSDERICNKNDEHDTKLESKEPELEKKEYDEISEYDKKKSDRDSDSDKKINDVDSEKTALTIADGIKTRARNNRETKFTSTVNIQVATPRKRKRKVSPICKDLSQKDSIPIDSNVEFKGFKKRMLAQASPATNSMPLTSVAGNNFHTSRELERIAMPPTSMSYGADSSTRLTEYAQYLGLQPTVKFKCFKCGESGFPSMGALHDHQIVCLKTGNSQSISKYVVATAQTPTTTSTTLSSGTPSTNFRITRKVYLCSACGTYYENWNLFEHMRVVHKRLICLYCLGMFAQADKLSAHLCNIHRMTEKVFQSAEHFMNEFKGSSFLMCCSCEKLFEDTNNFFDHHCDQSNVSGLCESCGVQGACHLTGCKQKVVTKTLPPSTTAPTDCVVTKSVVNSAKELKESPSSSKKYLLPSKKKVAANKEYKHAITLLETSPRKNKSQEKEFSDEDYDISDAASFCHVNIHEQPENQNEDITRKKSYIKKTSPSVEVNDEKHTNLDSSINQSDSDTESVKSYKHASDEDSSKPNEKISSDFLKETVPLESTRSYDFSERKKDENSIQRNTDTTAVAKNCNSQEPYMVDTPSPKSDDVTDKTKEKNKNEKCSSISKVLETENSLYSLKLDSIYAPPDTSKTADPSMSTQKCDENVGNDFDSDKPTKTGTDSADSQQDQPILELGSDQKPDALSKEEMAGDENSNTLPEARLSSHSLETNSNHVDEPIVKSPISGSKDGQDFDNHACTSDTQTKYNSSGSDNDTTHGSIVQSSSSDVSSDESQHQNDFTKNENKTQSHIDSEDENVDSDKMSLVVDENGSDNEIDLCENNKNNVNKIPSEDAQTLKQDTESDSESKQDSITDPRKVVIKEEMKMENKSQDIMHVAENDAPLLELTLDRNIDEISCAELIKESVKVSSVSCVYCNHAKKIAVNGKQLLLHVLAEHRFSIVVCSDSGELTEVNGFVSKLEKNVNELQDVFFNVDTYDSTTKVLAKSFDKTYECFHCHFVTASHKELYLHNRKMHQKTILLCIMCKSNFYSYSELLCHICPGIYVSDSNINFRCCLCDVDGLPSAFRLLVHLRKRHNACDVCLETTGDQQKLSNHVWKHKLHHLCYRCGIAYRNKPDITKHLFWKHGTESVLCKRCLQKKWPHVYHFCIPPTTFVCEECSAHFSRAVALKVHKRLHSGDLPYSCKECDESFISKKLLSKHSRRHGVSDKENILENAPVSNDEDHQKERDSDGGISQLDKCTKGRMSTDNELEVECVEKRTAPSIVKEHDDSDSCKGAKSELKEKSDKKSKVVDVYDLPPLNLSSDSDDSDDAENINKGKPENTSTEKPGSYLESKVSNEACSDENQQPAQVLDGIWDDFKTYKANLEKKENLAVGDDESVRSLSDVLHAIMLDHDYCGGTIEACIKTEIPGVSISAENAEQSLPPSVEVKDAIEEKTEDDKNRFDAEHNYCFSNDASPNENEVKESTSAPEESSTIPSKKKQKAVKKKQKRSASSSSSDSSSSDSSSCSCGTNCSCSSSSSSSSGSSSSQSSDSDSSSSEGRRRQAARRERRKERAKNKKKGEDTTKLDSKLGDASAPVCGSSPEVEEPVKNSTTMEQDGNEPTIKESDLETDETETDEDFYDQHPQKLANKLLAEKRNQLLLLAAVAPVNNGTIATTSSPVEVSREIPATSKKMKTKKRRKPQYQQHSNKKVKVDNLPKLNTSTSFYKGQVSTFTVNSPLPSASNQTPQVTIPTTAALPQVPYSPNIPHPTATPSYHSTGSGSETDSKRLSRRRRVPKRFYGDTSDEDGDSTPQRKWQKTSVNDSSLPVSSNFSFRSGVNSVSEPKRPVVAPLQEKSDDDVGEDSESEHEMKRSNSDSSNSDSDKGNEQSDLDSDTDNLSVTHTQTTVKSGEEGQQKSDNLYCYCQCPYDEVSEMIACDGKGCAIEWFHFECVGIMVPPKGEWFCPDCRKKLTARTDHMLQA
ncbi:serine-rich adhesin for platelets [Bacillus rossius redtenbacheri]|uniref:serine-rich adhesin for platelets n=1 Tax=Bacillus rossius redtenbacheri TaxID=93214 RepID=UPI002FDEE715